MTYCRRTHKIKDLCFFFLNIDNINNHGDVQMWRTRLIINNEFKEIIFFAKQL